jgi:hypothetical protein
MDTLNKHNVFAYSSYRTFLGDIARQLVEHQVVRSQRELSKSLKWPSTFLNAVLNDRAHITLSKALQFCKFLKMSHESTSFFLALWGIESPCNFTKEYFEQQLIKLRLG